MDKIRAGVVGVGRMGQYHVNVYSELIDVDLIGVTDTNSQKGKDVADRYGTTYFEDHKDLFGKVDIVSIAVPTSRHYSIAKDFLNAGVHVLIEKPMVHVLKEAEELFALAEKKGLTIHVGHIERFNGAVQELSKIVSDPIFIESRRLCPYDSRIQDDGVVMDIMIHDIDIILGLVKAEVDKINVIGSSVFSNKDDIVNVQIKFKNNCLANILASRTTQNKIRTLAVTQKDAYIFLDYTNQDIHIHRSASSEHRLTREELRYKQESLIEKIFVHRDNPLKLEIKHFIGCALNKTKRVIPVENELNSLKMAIKIVEEFNKGRG